MNKLKVRCASPNCNNIFFMQRDDYFAFLKYYCTPCKIVQEQEHGRTTEKLV